MLFVVCIESSEMEDYVWDPVAMFVDVGILIVEARTPDLSLKGRIEGPHCPHPHGGQGVKVKDLHRCDLHREQVTKQRSSSRGHRGPSVITDDQSFNVRTLL